MHETSPNTTCDCLAWKTKAEEYLAGWKRAKADFLNREREVERQREEFVKYAAARSVREMLPVYDALRAACAVLPQGDAATEWTKGVTHVCTIFERTLKGLGVERMETVGKLFDPRLHEAVGRRQCSEGQEPEAVLEEVGAGYTMHGETLVPAKVIIAEEHKDNQNDVPVEISQNH